MTWLLMFGLPVVAIIVIIGFAVYQASPVTQDERPEPIDKDDEGDE
ncbi:hypothetical protein [Marinactinospora rubrisoli]|uniref:Uncharacterized protein n=1 Tax=Marinactinospora rubrisoli TaxID=2715399 RepID=A0ABW2KBR1_9ACTN